MYPELFTIPYLGFTISSFGAMMVVAFLVGTWITSARMAEEGLDPEQATTMLLYVMLGGILGTKLYFAIDESMLGRQAFGQLFFSRGGMTWYGGLIGGVLGGALGCRLHRIPFKIFADCTAVAGAVGQALGRVGCFLVGDDYGHATEAPWGVAFPDGFEPVSYPVHPTQLYEILWLLPVAALLWARRRRSPFLFGEYLALNGLGRIVIENWRINRRVAWGFTEPQWIGAILIVLGVAGWIYYSRRPSRQSS